MIRRDQNDALNSFKTWSDKFFDEFSRDWFNDPSAIFPLALNEKDSFPKVDIINGADSYQLVAAVAGIPKENLKVELDENNVLTIEGNFQSKEEKDTGRFIRREIARRHFMRRFNFDGVITGEATSKLENGCLIVELKKKKAEVKENRSKVLEIQ